MVATYLVNIERNCSNEMNKYTFFIKNNGNTVFFRNVLVMKPFKEPLWFFFRLARKIISSSVFLSKEIKGGTLTSVRTS